MSADLKRFTTLQARAALSGVVVHNLKDDRGQPEYIVTKWSLTKALSSLDALEAWIDQMTGGRNA
ncbi:hypothetical protein [Variovorax sp. LG9.2]|uniref:hypothetical protein n=1 Tax=Variovorax sp. LG9.2 TaxID=3048626 RepID=UPI002B23486C|nr:hypothetical protein [Variovorax sp. LG9.2]MEB0059249.1 hypothetical protein [Variovorax sp. LG9.2]